MTDKKYERYYGLAGKASFENWDNVMESGMCGCYYCGHIFPSSEVTDADWVPDLHGRTVLCPRCGIDAVIGDASGIPIRQDVLDELYEAKFGAPDDDDPEPRCIVSDDSWEVIPVLDKLRIHAFPQTELDKVLSEAIPNIYYFDTPGAGQRRTASELRVAGTVVVYGPSGVQSDETLDCIELSDIVLFAGKDVPDVGFTGGFNDKFFIQTLGEEGLRYKFRSAPWKTFPTPPDAVPLDCDIRRSLVSAALIAVIGRTGKRFDDFEEMDAIAILRETLSTVAEAQAAGC